MTNKKIISAGAYFLVSFFIFASSQLAFGAGASELDLSKGILASAKGDWAQAKIEFENAVRAVPDSEMALSYLGQTYYQLGEYERAVRIFQQLVQRFPDRSDFHLHLGLTFFKLGKDDKAQREFQMAESIVPESSQEDFQRDFQEGYKEKTKFWRIRLSSGTQYDSNVVLAPLDSELSQRVSRKWGLRQIMLGSAELSHSFFENLRSGLTYTYYQALNFNLEQNFDPTVFNLQDHSLGLSSSYEGSNSLL